MSNQLSKNLFSGFIWTSLQTVGTKLISIVAQLILAWLLMPEDFGKVSIAVSLTSITFLIQGLGLSDVLISRQHMFDRVFNLSKSLALVTTIICFGLTIFLAIIAGFFIYDDIEITYLILIYSFAIPFNSMSIIADAKLRIDLKFKDLSFIRLSEFFINNFLLVCLVLVKFGIYSFVIAPLVASIFRYFFIHYKSKVQHTFTFTLLHYKYLLTNSIYVFLHNFFQTIIRQSDYLIIGAIVSAQSVGLYFMGYSLSVQVIALLVASLSPVFFPVLKTIPKHETEKIKSILLKIVTIFSIFGMCFSMLQASLSGPLVRLFLEDKWLKTIEIVQILSIGIGFNVASTVWAVAFRLNDNFKRMAKYSLFSVFVFLILVILFTLKLEIIGTAIGVCLFNILVNFILMALSLGEYDIKVKTLLSITLKYFILAFLCFYSLFYISNFYKLSDLIKIFTNGLLPVLLYFTTLYFFDKKSKDMLLVIINKYIKKQ